VVTAGLGYPHLLDPDEAHYAQLTREMLRAGSWLVPLLDGQPYIDKPILFHWLQAASMAALGESEFAVRLPSALAALALIVTTRWIGRSLLGAAVGEWGAAMFATVPLSFALGSIGLLDTVYSAFLFGAVGCLLIASRDCRRGVECAGYGLLALAVLTKGPMAVAIAGLFLATAWACGGELRDRVDRLHWKTGLLATTVLAAPWFVWMYVRYGDLFVQGYLLAGNLHYVTQPLTFSGRTVSHTYYARALFAGFFPWSALLAARGLDRLLAREHVRWSPEEKLLWLWTAIIIGFFSVARFKLDHYIFPAAPAVCLIAARAWVDAAQRVPHTQVTRLAVMGIGGALIVAGSFISAYLFELNLELPASAILFPLVLALGGVAVLLAMSRAAWRVPATPVSLVAMLICVYAIVVAIGFPTLDRTRPTAAVAIRLHQRAPTDAVVGLYRLEQWRSSLRYYSQRPLAKLSTPLELTEFVSGSNRPVYVLMTRRDYRTLRKSFGLREVFRRRGVVRTAPARGGLRRQYWDDLIVVTNAATTGVWLP
jgi:4-amino-4-deoxy-L-arabinose transferase-like glycosyltransferase